MSPTGEPVTGHHAFLLLLSSIDTDALAVAAETLETNLTVDLCEQCIIRTDADIVARMNMCAALTNKDIARQNVLTVTALYAKALCFGITAVLGRANALLMSEELHTDTQHLDCTSVIKCGGCSQHSSLFEGNGHHTVKILCECLQMDQQPVQEFRLHRIRRIKPESKCVLRSF